MAVSISKDDINDAINSALYGIKLRPENHLLLTHFFVQIKNRAQFVETIAIFESVLSGDETIKTDYLSISKFDFALILAELIQLVIKDDQVIQTIQNLKNNPIQTNPNQTLRNTLKNLKRHKPTAYLRFFKQTIKTMAKIIDPKTALKYSDSPP